MGPRLIGYILVGAGIVLGCAAIYFASNRDVPLIFSPTQLLGATWNQYKTEYLEAGTSRTLDRQRQSITTSEGQSYTMLRAVWMGDKPAFDASWQWTKDNLRRPNDHLFSWLFGRRPDGSYGVLTQQNGDTTASDADQDIAMALIFAYARWQDKSYLDEARALVHDLWELEVFTTADGTPYLAANNYEKFSQDASAIVNPSYLSPAAYRIFALIDPAHPWQKLVDSSYKLLQSSIDSPLGGTSAGLPPDWVRVHKQTGALTVPGGDLTTNFSYDALRVPWRLGLDYQWYGDERALQTLQNMSKLGEEWQQNGKLAPSYTHDGTVIAEEEVPAMYGGTIAYFALVEPAEAARIYETKLQYLFDPGKNAWKERLSYYDDNWAWFGIGLYHKLLPNLAASIPPSVLSE
jgi:endoglucanase